MGIAINEDIRENAQASTYRGLEENKPLKLCCKLTILVSIHWH